MLIWKSFSKIANRNLEFFEALTDLSADTKDAKYTRELENLIKDASKKFTKKKHFDDMLIAMFAVVMSVAVCDDDFSREEKRDIDNFISILEESDVSIRAKRTIKKMYNRPPSFVDVTQYVSQVDRTDWKIFDHVIDWMRMSDAKVSEQERKYKIQWNDFKEKNRIKLIKN
jgi:prenyltransferase beta subunit